MKSFQRHGLISLPTGPPDRRYPQVPYLVCTGMSLAVSVGMHINRTKKAAQSASEIQIHALFSHFRCMKMAATNDALNVAMARAMPSTQR